MTRRTAGVWATLLVAACMPAAPAARPSSSDAASADPDDRVPAGFGSLRQDQISMAFAVGPVRVQITPLDPGLIRLAAPDTWERLAALRSRAAADDEAAGWFLVSLQTEDPGGAEFDPTDLEILAQGTVHRAQEIVALTPGWGSGRLRQRSTEQALYRFPPDVDPWAEMEVRVGDVRYTGWSDRLPALHAESARVRARAGGLRRPDRTS